ncbi:MAG: hypothetical protein JWM89_477 [Acidimicrobiales bacterium]|nr:hypothetical protein [Acidimicrobiales bacterium]
MRRHPIRSVAAVGCSSVLILVVLAVGWVRWSTRGSVYEVGDVPAAPVAIVLGAGLHPDGTPSEYLEARLRDATRLYKRHKVQAILVSGDNSRTDYDEVGAMSRWLVAHQVPAAKVVSDHAGFDTYDSCQRAHRIFGVDRAIVITQGFHIHRAVFLCRQAGIDTVGVASVANGGSPAMNAAREMPASVKAAWDALIDPGPRYLGPRDHGVDDATEES